jgi:hypothetical protein
MARKKKTVDIKAKTDRKYCKLFSKRVFEGFLLSSQKVQENKFS